MCFKTFHIMASVVSLCLVFLLSVIIPATGADEFNIDESKRVLKNLDIQSLDAEIYSKWDKYLKQLTSFTNAEYQSAIVSLGVDFARSISEYEKCIEMAEKGNPYSSSWMKDFQKDFDDEYISRNLASIKFVLLSIHVKNWSNYYEPVQKEAIYREVLYREVLNQYARHLIDFSKTMEKESQDRIKDRTACARSILATHQHPLREMLISGDKASLYSAALQNRKDIDPRLVGFYSKHPFFSKPFDLIRAAGEFKKYEKPE